MIWLIVTSAFEFARISGPPAAMLAGCAVPGARNGLGLNPALVVGARRAEVSAAYVRPYGIVPLDHAELTGGWHAGRVAAAGGLSVTSLGRYSESDVQACIAVEPVPGIVFGVGAHALLVAPGSCGADAVPALDAGVCAKYGRLRAGLSALKANSPRWRDGTEQPARLVFGAAWNPVDALLLALDLSRERGSESASFGAELRLAPQLVLRLGASGSPLILAGGAVVQVCGLALDYAYRFHPVLGDSHSLGLEFAWL